MSVRLSLPAAPATRLWLFGLLSLGVHALLLLPSVGPPEWGQTATQLHVSFANHSISTDNSAASKTPELAQPSAAEARHIDAPVKAAAVKPVAALAPATAPVTDTSDSMAAVNEMEQAPPSSATHQALQARTQISARLNQILTLHLRYPELARQRGWQGQVLLSMDLSAHGEITNIAIKRSSGYRLLDHNARDSLAQLGQVEWAVPLLRGAGMQIDLPVIYQLKRI